MTFCTHTVCSGRAEQHSISLSSLGKHKDNSLRDPPTEKLNKKIAFLFFHLMKHLSNRLDSTASVEAEQHVAALKKCPSARVWSGPQAAPRGRRAFDSVAGFRGCERLVAFDICSCHVSCGKAGLLTLLCHR